MTLPSNGYGRVIVAMTVLALMAGCQRLTTADIPPPIHYVVIDDGVSDTDLRTKAGDEVRWVNVRAAPVVVIFPGLVSDELSCNRGFSKEDPARVTAIILPDDTASLCFSKAGRLTYRVVDAQRPGVELNHAATVQVVDAGGQPS